MTDNQPYPAYSRSERIADGSVHAVGVLLALAGAALLLGIGTGGATGLHSGPLTGPQMAGLGVYATALILTFAASACYHMTPWEAVRPLLRRIDHAAIYLKIAGTYTPLVMLIGSGFAYAVLGLVWVLALGGAAAKLWFWRTPGRFGPALYLLLGWLSVALLWPMAVTLPPAGTGLVVAGGLLYSAGVIFFARENLRFSNAIWHGFVLAASGCFFVAILVGVSSLQTAGS